MKRIARVGSIYRKEFENMTFEQIAKTAAEEFFEDDPGLPYVTVYIEDVDTNIVRAFGCNRVEEWVVTGMRGGE